MTKEEWRDFAKEVHENAVRSGFWDDHDLNAAFALAHCEWSAAMEEARQGMPMIYYVCEPYGEICQGPCKHMVNGACNCGAKSHIPEGAAVKLVDGCLRILDIAAWLDLSPEILPNTDYYQPDFPAMILTLHKWTLKAYDAHLSYNAPSVWFNLILTVCMNFIRGQGQDPEALMKEKHEYGKSLLHPTD